ncbi:hypothetical protein O3G_MSEX006018 [Manduca sexta]|uniref:Gustatory receptor 32 n=1 Tax=Manduca sexta TaxID=7130 RepID=A0A5K8B1C6_MANSE|nr:hypothetical protein O3G_MSEX006018 [Manduca sexta]CUQ99372.1 TPA: Gustatory receptor 32 [Manduca sexta]
MSANDNSKLILIAQIPKDLFFASIKFMLLCRFFCGLYYEMSSSRVVQLLGQLYCVSMLFMRVTLLISLLPFMNLIPLYLFIFILIVLSVTVSVASLLSKDIYFMEYLSDLEGHAANVTQKTLTSFIPFIITLTIIFGNVLISHTFSINMVIKPTIIIPVSMFTFYAYFYPVIVMLHIHYNEIKELQHKLRVNLNEDLIEDEKINAIPSFLNEYRFLFSVGVLSQSARMLCTIYYYLSEELGIEVRFLLNGFFDVIMSIGITFMPVMLLEMSMHITNDIQRMLSRHLLQYKGPRLREAIYDSLDYIEIHGMKVTLWAHFPMDLSFFFSFVSLVTAYAIAVLQFKY